MLVGSFICIIIIMINNSLFLSLIMFDTNGQRHLEPNSLYYVRKILLKNHLHLYPFAWVLVLFKKMIIIMI